MTIISKEIDAYYRNSDEQHRLFTGEGELERLRTQSILARNLPPAPAVIYDIGGAAGVYAFHLANQGYQVHLIDPVEPHIEQAKTHAVQSGIKLASISLGDARHLNLDSGIADAVLLLGPLYHLTDRSDRILALKEAYRILKPGGVIFAAGISRFASFLDSLFHGTFKDALFREIITGDLTTGQHRNPTDNPYYFTSAYLHLPEELKTEINEAEFNQTRLLAVEGVAYNTAHFREIWDDPVQRNKLMEFLTKIEEEPSILGASAHFIGVAYR
ncbi:MAG: class I SAM-dependent methyltransferase [bacterium]